VPKPKFDVVLICAKYPAADFKGIM